MYAAPLKELLEALLPPLGVEPVRTSIEEGERPVARLEVPEGKHLIGPGGETLRALNHLLKRLLEKRVGKELRVSFVVDVNGYFEKKVQTVRANARMLGERARLFRHDVELSPMSAYERMLIHELFAEDPNIETVSQGEGKFRHVVLRFVEQKHSGSKIQ